MISYINVAKAVALRSGQLKDAIDAATLNTNYEGDLIANMEGVEIPYSALKRDILASEKRIAEIIAQGSNPVYRLALFGRTVDLPDNAQIPTFDQSGNEFIGSLGNIIDSYDDSPLTEQPKQLVMIRRRNAGEFFRLSCYHYCIENGRVFHTRDSVFLEGCVWSEDAQSSAYDASDATSLSPLPQHLENFLIADVLANLPQENWFTNESGIYRQIATASEFALRQNMTPTASLPSTTSNTEPVKN